MSTRTWRRWSWLLLWAACVARARAQPLHAPEAPPVPPDTAEIERERARARATATTESSKAAPPAQTGELKRSGPQPAPPPGGPSPAALPALEAEPAPQPDQREGPKDPRSALTEFPPASAPDATTAGATQPAAPPASVSPPPLAAGTSAQAPAWSAAALLGMGVTFDHTIAGVNPLGFGFGLRGEYRGLRSWAVGARMVYFAGGSSVLPTGRVSMQSWLLALEGAYVLQLDPLIIQPGILLGLHVREIDNRLISVDLPGPDLAPGRQNKTQLGLYLAPGVNIVLPLGNFSGELDYLFVGADLRVDLVLGSGVTGNLQLLFQGGVRF